MLATTTTGRWSLVELALPGSMPVPAGVLLEDPAADRLYVRLRRDWESIAPEEADVLEALAADLEAKSVEMGAAALLEYLERTLSNAIRLSGRQEILVADFRRTLERLYRGNVSTTVVPFRTHVPRYASLELAAGPFRPNVDDLESGVVWEELPEGVRGGEEYFAGEIFGRSMEPEIPDGSVCLFRKGVAGSRQGRLVLVQETGMAGSAAFTVKRYRSEKRLSPEGSWTQERIWLEALNPEFGSIELDPEAEEGRYRVIAEFVRVVY